MARRTKAELIQIREATYKPPEIPDRRCETCRFAWCSRYHSPVDGASCHAIEIRGELRQKQVHLLGVCDLYEAKESSDGK